MVHLITSSNYHLIFAEHIASPSVCEYRYLLHRCNNSSGSGLAFICVAGWIRIQILPVLDPDPHEINVDSQPWMHHLPGLFCQTLKFV
jgi:hypothetical protein